MCVTRREGHSGLSAVLPLGCCGWGDRVVRGGWERGALALGVPWRACLLHGLLPTVCACGARTHARAVFGVATARCEEHGSGRPRPSLVRPCSLFPWRQLAVQPQP